MYFHLHTLVSFFMSIYVSNSQRSAAVPEDVSIKYLIRVLFLSAALNCPMSTGTGTVLVVRTILYRYITVEKYAWPGQIAPTFVADEQSTRYMAIPMALYQYRYRYLRN
jgi:hypothetical protein